MKNLPKFAVNRPITIMMISIVMIGFGLYGLGNLRLNLYPDVSFPTVTVYRTYEGVALEDIETLMTRQIEEQVGSISGVRRICCLQHIGSAPDPFPHEPGRLGCKVEFQLGYRPVYR